MEKTKSAYKTIGEVALEIGLRDKKNKKLNTHTLRFWEKHFKQIRPKILSGNRRYYSNKDVQYLKLIYELLKNKGFTIKGAKKALNDPSLKLDDALFSGVNRKNFGISIKMKADKIKNIIKKINDTETKICAIAERKMLQAVGGDCETAIGGLARIKNNNLELKAQLFSDEGDQSFNYELKGPDVDAENIGKAVGKRLLKLAGKKFKKK